MHRLAAAPFILMLALLTVVTSGCRHRDRQEDTLVTAYKMIDAHRDDEAILLLESEYERTPADSPYRKDLIVAEASAYAHKAGFKVQKVLGPSKAMKDNKIDFTASKDAFDRVDASKPGVEKQEEFMAAIAIFMKNLISFTAIFNAIPHVQPEDEKFLQFSLELLNSLGTKNIPPKYAVYRAVIRIIYIKTVISHFGDNSPVDVAVNNCQVDLDKFTDKMNNLRDLGVATFQDLAIASPSKGKSYQRSSDNFVNIMSRLTQVNSIASIFDSASMLFLKQALIQNGLKDILKCSATPLASATSAPSSSSSAHAGI